MTAPVSLQPTAWHPFSAHVIVAVGTMPFMILIPIAFSTGVHCPFDHAQNPDRAFWSRRAGSSMIDRGPARAREASAQHALPRDRPLRQSDRPWAPDDGKRDLAQLRALDPMPVLGDVGVVSYILNCIVKLASATSTADICSRSVLRAAELDPRGHKRAVDAHRLLCLAVAMRVRAAGRLRHRRHAHRRGRSDALPSVGAEYPERSRASPRAREAAAGQAQI